MVHDDQNGITASWLGFDHESGIVKYLLAVGTGEGRDLLNYGIRLQNFKSILFADDLTSASGGWIDFSTETDGYIEGLSLNVTEETGTLYYVTAYAINGAGDGMSQPGVE